MLCAPARCQRQSLAHFIDIKQKAPLNPFKHSSEPSPLTKPFLSPHALHHVHHACLCSTLPTCRGSSLSRVRARAPTIAQCSGMQVRPLAKAAASCGCVDGDDGDECCIRSCTCTGNVVDSSAQRGSRLFCSCICREHGFVCWGSHSKCVDVQCGEGGGQLLCVC